MSDCNKIIEKIYLHPDLTNLIKKIKPVSIQEDLKQEVAISLLEKPCDKISELFAGNNLLRYVAKICWIMATSTTHDFYKKYKQNDYKKAIQYMEFLDTSEKITTSYTHEAYNFIKNKNKNIFDDHEARIFKTFIELGSARKVAKYYNIPVNHCCNIIRKVKSELKKLC